MYKIRKNVGILILLAFLGAFAVSNPARAERGLSVAVIAPSISARTAAHETLWNLGWTETKNLGQAEAVIVACNSNESWPLNNTYNSINELESDALLPANASGSDTHIYVYKINADMSVDEIKYLHLPGEGGSSSQFTY